jgi:Domain of unknown function (DUF4350)
MRERLVTFALALAAFAMFYALLAPKPAPPQEIVTRPITIEKGPNGYFAMERWLSAAGLDVVSVRERFSRLDEGLTGEGGLLITTAPHRYPLRHSELQPLRAWIARGNTLLVLAGLSDTPEWSMGEGADPAFMENMKELTRLTFTEARPSPTASGPEGGPALEDGEAHGGEQTPADETDPPDAEQSLRTAADAFKRFGEAKRFALLPNGPHPLLAGVEVVAALSEYPAAKWFATVQPDRLLVELAHEPESNVPVLWLLRYGDGQVLVSAYGSLFTNKLLGEEDNARLLGNIVAWSVAASGKVLIDDAHQGLVAFYDPDAFFGDRRLHTTLWLLIGLWLLFVLGPRPLHASVERWRPIEVTGFVRATGGFLARVLKSPAVAQRLFENFFNDLHRQSGRPADGAPLWEWIGAQAAVSPAELAQLRDWHARAAQGRRVNLRQVQTLLARVRSQLR